jgi:hypothetical protein
MNPTKIVFPPYVDLRAPKEPADVILFPKVRGLFADLIKDWKARGYDVTCSTRGNLIVKRASRATVFFNRIRRGAK